MPREFVRVRRTYRAYPGRGYRKGDQQTGWRVVYRNPFKGKSVARSKFWNPDRDRGGPYGKRWRSMGGSAFQEYK